jgi:hypothetical protein
MRAKHKNSVQNHHKKKVRPEERFWLENRLFLAFGKPFRLKGEPKFKIEVQNP